MPSGAQNEPNILFVNSNCDGYVLTSGYGAGIVNINLDAPDDVLSQRNILTKFDLLVLTVGRVAVGTTFDTCLYATADFIVA